MFEVATQTAIAPQPSAGTLYHPAARQDGKPVGVCGAPHDLQAPPKLFADLGDNMFIGAICPNELAATPAIVPGAFALGKERLPHQLAARAIRNAGTMNNHHPPQAQHVDHNMALAAIGLLVHIHASGFASFRSFHALTVDNRGARLRIAPGVLSAVFTTIVFSRVHNPFCVQRQKYPYPVAHGGKLHGNIRH
jgi:hypothetical protein